MSTSLQFQVPLAVLQVCPGNSRWLSPAIHGTCTNEKGRPERRPNLFILLIGARGFEPPTP